MTKISQYFWALMEQAPSLLAMLACLVFALTRWKRYPKVSLAVASGLGLLVVHAIVFVLVYDLVPPLFLKGAASQTFEESRRVSRAVFLVLGLIYNILKVVGFALVLTGIFMQRPPRQAQI